MSTHLAQKALWREKSFGVKAGGVGKQSTQSQAPEGLGASLGLQACTPVRLHAPAARFRGGAPLPALGGEEGREEGSGPRGFLASDQTPQVTRNSKTPPGTAGSSGRPRPGVGPWKVMV